MGNQDFRASVRALLAEYRAELSRLERQALLEVLLRPNISADDIAEAAALHGTKKAETLKELERRGFIICVGKSPKKYISQNPKAVFDMLERRVQNRHRMRTDIESQLMQIYETKVLSPAPVPNENDVKVTPRVGDAISWALDSLRGAKRKILIVGGDLSGLSENPSVKSEILAHRGKCEIRVLYYGKDSAQLAGALKELQDLGVPTCKSERLATPTLLVDDDRLVQAYTQTREDGANQGVYLFMLGRSASFVGWACFAFEQEWSRMGGKK